MWMWIFPSIDACAIKLPKYTSKFLAEANAFSIAAEEGLREDKNNVLFTDSASVLIALESDRTHRSHSSRSLDVFLRRSCFALWTGCFCVRGS